MRHQTRPVARTATILFATLGVAAACGHGPAPTQRHTVSFVVANDQLNFAVEMAHGFRAGVATVGGVDPVVTGPPSVDGPREVQLFQSAPKSKNDGISVFTLSPELFAGPLSAAVDAGVPVIAVDNPPGPGAHVSLFIGNDNYQLGQLLADEAIKRMPAGASGEVVLGTTSPGVSVLDLRAKGIRDQFHTRLPKVDVLGPFDTKQDVVANLASWQILVQANPTALAFLGTGDSDGWNLASIRKKTHAKWLAGAYDLDPRSLAAAKDGDLLLVSPEHYIKGAITGRLQADHAKNGTPLPVGWIMTPGLAVTKANVAAVSARQQSTDARAAWFAPQIDDILQHQSAHIRPLSAL
ncbi:MAG: ribose transport system substrate-binding protein [Micromonosporaceae bacterium]